MNINPLAHLDELQLKQLRNIVVRQIKYTGEQMCADIGKRESIPTLLDRNYALSAITTRIDIEIFDRGFDS